MTTLNIRVDENLKKQANELFEKLGLNMTTAINMFLKRSLLERGIPFLVDLNVPNEKTVAALKDAEAGKDVYGPFDSVESLMESLNA